MIENLLYGTMKQYCPWCDNTGFVTLRHRLSYPTITAGREYEEDMLAACRACALGHRKHERWPHLPFSYRAEDIDLGIGFDMERLPLDLRRRIEAVNKAIAARQNELQVGVALESFAPGLGSSPDRLDAESEGQISTPDTRNEGTGP